VDRTIAGTTRAGPQPCERGWVIMVDPADDIIQFDVCGHQSANYTYGSDLRRAGDRHEADSEKWLPGDPFGPAIPPFDDRDLQTVRRWLKEAELAVQVDYVRSGGAGGQLSRPRL
jgi:hypothetical protein